MDGILKRIEEFMANKWFKYGVFLVGGVLMLCIIASIGIFVAGPGNRFERRASRLLPVLPFLRGHGAMGTLQNIDGQILRVELRDGTTQFVLIDNNTRLERNRQRITLNDLKTGDDLAVVGSPNDQGQIVARWIQILRPRTPTPASQ